MHAYIHIYIFIYKKQTNKVVVTFQCMRVQQCEWSTNANSDLVTSWTNLKILALKKPTNDMCIYKYK